MFYDYILNIARNAWGLAIKASSSAVAKTVNTVNCFINGVFTTKTAGDVSLTNYTYVNNNGAVTTAALTIADGYTVPLTIYTDGTSFFVGKGNVVANTASLKDSDFETSLNNRYAKIGNIIVKNATGSTFTGGTTALDTANLTVTYIDAYSSLWV